MKRFTYPLLLKVCKPCGERITAFIRKVDAEKNIIEIPCLDVVEKENPDFASNGTIRFAYPLKDHKKVIAKMTSYLENLFLKELSNDESNDSVQPVRSNTGGDEINLNSKPVKAVKGKDSSGVYSSGRGEEST